MISAPPPLSLYIHFPWCVKKCPYCDFNSHALKDSLPEQAYIEALTKQLKIEMPLIGEREIKSIFMGGGTPSLFSGQSMGLLLDFIRRHLKLSPDIEITLEANPGTVEQKRFQTYFEVGINRISLGVQSFDPIQLKKLGRIHSSDEARVAIDALQHAGFENFNIDLMYGLPEQTLEEALDDLKIALSFAPPHLSWYQLTLEPNTYFYRFPPPLPSDEFIAEIEDSGRALIQERGLSRYEISAYSKNRVCQHNLNYWQFGDYIGIGAGAHGKRTDMNTARIHRTQCFKHPTQYLDENLGFYQKNHTIPENEISFEYMLNSLRLIQGTPIDNFSKYTFLALETIQPQLEIAYRKKLIYPFSNKLQATELGLQFLNDLTLLFVPND